MWARLTIRSVNFVSLRSKLQNESENKISNAIITITLLLATNILKCTLLLKSKAVKTSPMRFRIKPSQTFGREPASPAPSLPVQ